MELDKIAINPGIFVQERWANFERYGDFWSKEVYTLAMQEALLTMVGDRNLGSFLYEKGGYFDSHSEIKAIAYHLDKWFVFQDDSFQNRLEKIAVVSNLLPLCFLSPTETEPKHDIFNELFGLSNVEVPPAIDSYQL